VNIMAATSSEGLAFGLTSSLSLKSSEALLKPLTLGSLPRSLPRRR
jgi:hypothetical protein